MWIPLVIGIVAVIVGIGMVIKSSMDHERDPVWLVGVTIGCILIALSIFTISSFGNDMGNRADPPPPITKQGHIYEVIDSMKFKKGYLISFKEIIPNQKDTPRVRFFEKVPPRLFKSTQVNGKEVYVPFKPPDSN